MNMKIKILRGDRGKWYYNTDNIGKEFRDIEYIGSSSFRFLIKGSYWVDKDDCVITELPKSFCVKRCDDNNRDDWNKYLQWLNKQKNYPIPMFGGVDRYKYYGINGENLHSDYLYPFGTEIHIDDMIKHIDFYSEPMVIESKEEFDMTTNKGRLAYAKRNYPVGTKYKSIVSGQELIAGDYDGHLNGQPENIWLVYYNGKWADIIDEVKEEFDMSTNEGRLAYAKKHYPIGTVIKSIHHDKVYKLIREPRNYMKTTIVADSHGVVPDIYHCGEWAKIIDEVKEEEFDMSTPEGILAYAKKHYPIGTKYIPLDMNGKLFTSNVFVSHYDAKYWGREYNMIEVGDGLIYKKGKWAEIVKEKVEEEIVMETNLLELIRLFPELPTDYAKKLVQKVLEVKEGNLINLANFIGSADTPTPFYEIITGSKSEQKANYVWRKIYDFKNNKMETQKLSRQGLKEIHSVACSNWKGKLEGMGIRNTLEDYIEVTQNEVDEMFKACTKEQLPIVSKYLKQDDGSVDLETLCLRDNEFLTIRSCFEYTNKAFWLNDKFNWEIKKDSDDELCLIPTKKK